MACISFQINHILPPRAAIIPLLAMDNEDQVIVVETETENIQVAKKVLMFSYVRGPMISKTS